MSEGAVCPHCFRNYLKDNGCHYIFACGLTAQGFEVNKGCGRSFCSQCNKKFCSQQYDSRTGVKSETYLDHHDNVCCRKEIGFKEEDYCPGNHNSHCSKRW